jgi:hypothetical protein
VKVGSKLEPLRRESHPDSLEDLPSSLNPRVVEDSCGADATSNSTNVAE